jgi:hypothetical protein
MFHCRMVFVFAAAITAISAPVYAQSNTALVGEFAGTGVKNCLAPGLAGFDDNLAAYAPQDSETDNATIRGTFVFSPLTSVDASGNGYGTVTIDVQNVGITVAAAPQNTTYGASAFVQSDQNNAASYEIVPSSQGLVFVNVGPDGEQGTFLAGGRVGQTYVQGPYQYRGHLSVDGNSLVLTEMEAYIEYATYSATPTTAHPRICTRSLVLVRIQ